VRPAEVIILPVVAIAFVVPDVRADDVIDLVVKGDEVRGDEVRGDEVRGDEVRPAEVRGEDVMADVVIF